MTNTTSTTPISPTTPITTSPSETASSRSSSPGSGPARRHLPIEHTDGAPLAPDDPRVPLARSVQTAATVLAELTGADAGNPTPCTDWNAHQLAGHMVAVVERVAALPTGVPIDDMALVRDDIAVDGLSEAFHTAAHAARAAWTAAALDSTVIAPWGPIPGVVAMHVYSAELLIHTWDLATAIGVEPQWHQPDVEAALHAVQMGIPAEGRQDVEMPFDSVTPTDDDAPAIHRLVAWVGRTLA